MKKQPKTTEATKAKAFELANAHARDLRDSSYLYQMTRRQRRKEKKRVEQVQQFFQKIAEDFIQTELLEGDVEKGGEKSAQILDFYDRRWRVFARNHITRNKGVFQKSEKREALTNHFIKFVDRYHKKQKQRRQEEASQKPPAMGLSEEEKSLEVRKALKEVGVNSQAKTLGGLKRIMKDKLKPGTEEYAHVVETIKRVYNIEIKE